MRKLQVCLKVILILLIYSILVVANGAEKRFDFEVHRGHFLNGEYQVSTQIGNRVHVMELTFKDGCAVKFDQQDSGQASNWRWSRRSLHGKLMNWTLKFEKT